MSSSTTASGLSPANVRSGPLAGIRVLEIAQFIAGPYAGMMLADLGADVIKIERPGAGDPFRGFSERHGVSHPQFAAYNRNKRSVALDFKTEVGRDALLGLMSSVDVVMENFRPGTLERSGLGYEDISEANPGLIYCSVTGVGSTGPERDRPVYDATAQAMSGLWSLLTDADDPVTLGPAFSDQITGLYTAQAILAALVARGTSGVGQRVEISMLEACVAFLTEPMANFLVHGEVATPYSRPKRSQSYAFVCSDGRPLGVHLSVPQKFWSGLCLATERADLLEDPRFVGRRERIANYEGLRDELAREFVRRPRDEWLRRLEEHDVPAAPINTVAEAIEAPQAQALGLVRTFGEGEDAMRLVRQPTGFAGTPASDCLGSPGLGEHTAQVLAELGWSDERIAELEH